jgi:hypothetical protein
LDVTLGGYLICHGDDDVGGQLWMFAIGVGHYVYEHFDIDRIKFLASSSGTFAAVPLACGLDPYDWCRRDWAKCIEHFESRGALGCLYDTKHFYYNLWDEYLPKDAHVRCSGRLFISVTMFPSMKNRVVRYGPGDSCEPWWVYFVLFPACPSRIYLEWLVDSHMNVVVLVVWNSQFNSREELIWTIVGSICLPYVFIADFPVKCSDEVSALICAADLGLNITMHSKRTADRLRFGRWVQ